VGLGVVVGLAVLRGIAIAAIAFLAGIMGLGLLASLAGLVGLAGLGGLVGLVGLGGPGELGGFRMALIPFPGWAFSHSRASGSSWASWASRASWNVGYSFASLAWMSSQASGVYLESAISGNFRNVQTRTFIVL
jgi:hypothetical protein